MGRMEELGPPLKYREVMIAIIPSFIDQFVPPPQNQKDSEVWQWTTKTTKWRPIAAIGPDVVSLLEHINIVSSTWDIAIGLLYVFFSICNRSGSHLCRKRKQYYNISRGLVKSYTLHYNILQKDWSLRNSIDHICPLF